MYIDKLKFDKNGLIPAVIQDFKNREVLMLGYMNKQAVKKTLKDKKVCFYSRSRKKLWVKGESSGFTQKLKSLYVDCDMDCLLVLVDQKTAACHTGYRSCFYRKLKHQIFRTIGKKVFDPEKVYK